MGWILLTVALIAVVVACHGGILDGKQAAKVVEEARRSVGESARRCRQQSGVLNQALFTLRPFTGFLR